VANEVISEVDADRSIIGNSGIGLSDATRRERGEPLRCQRNGSDHAFSRGSGGPSHY
jgi:hypothetical protein